MDAKPDFASLLDDLFDAGDGEGTVPAPAVDYLSVAEELCSGRIRVSPEVAAAEYREAASALEEEFIELLDQTEVVGPDEASLAVEPEAIAGELGLEGRDLAGLAQARRLFALRNHPDRVPPHLRDRASARMTIANMLIDEAQRKAGFARA